MPTVAAPAVTQQIVQTQAFSPWVPTGPSPGEDVPIEVQEPQSGESGTYASIELTETPEEVSSNLGVNPSALPASPGNVGFSSGFPNQTQTPVGSVPGMNVAGNAYMGIGPGWTSGFLGPYGMYPPPPPGPVMPLPVLTCIPSISMGSQGL